MYEVRVQAHFRAEHRLTTRGGQQEPAHTHDWIVEAVFRGPGLDENGVLIDFTAAEKALQIAVDPLDHTNLNEAPFSAGANPSAERLARHLFDVLGAQLGPTTPLAAIYVHEAPGCTAGYSPLTTSIEPTSPPPPSHRN